MNILRHGQHLSRGLSFFPLLVALAVSLAPAIQAQEATDAVRKQITVLAEIIHADARPAEQVMASLGFPSKQWSAQDRNWRGFDHWPLDRKIETAWLAAEEAQEGEGDRFLKEYAQRLARKNRAVTLDPALKEFFPDPLARPKITKGATFRFVPPGQIAAESLAKGAPPRVREVVSAVAKHASSYPGGSLNLVLRCCNISEANAWKMIREAGSVEEMLLQALKQGDLPPEMVERLAKLTREGLRFDAAISAEIANTDLKQAMRRYVSKGSNMAGRSERARELGLAIRSAVESADAVTTLADDVERQAARVLEELPVLKNTESALRTVKASVQGGSQVASELAGAVAQPAADMAASAVSSAAGSGSARAAAPAGRSVSTAAYRSFQLREYGRSSAAASGSAAGRTPGWVSSGSTGGRHAFRSVVRSGRGFGGIVFGNELSAGKGTARPLDMMWHDVESGKNGDREDSGILVFGLEGGRQVYSPQIYASDLMAAYRAVYGVPGVMDALAEGESMGLVGYTGQTNAYEISDGVVKSRDVTAATFLVHPALSRGELGKAAIIVDAMPFLMKKRLLDQTQQETVSATKQRMFRDWLGTEWSTYKFIDVPLKILIDEHGIVHASRKDELPKGSPQSLADSAFVTKIIFDPEGAAIPGSDELFYPLVPELTVISESFARINDFAQVLALVRWAKSTGAEVLGLPQPAPAPFDWSTVFVDEERGQVELGPAKHEVALGIALAVEKEAQRILDGNPSLAPLKQISEDIFQNRLERISVDFLLEAADLRVIANTHLDADTADSLLEKSRAASESEFSHRFDALRDSIVARAESGDIEVMEALAELQVRGAALVQQLQDEQFDGQLSSRARKNSGLAADMKRHAELRRRAEELENADRLSGTKAKFLKGLDDRSLAKGETFERWYRLQKSYAETCPSGACI